MSRLGDLVRQVAASDPQLAKDINAEVKALQRRRAFGLNFERHTPESVDLYGRPVRRGDKVRILPPRGESDPPGRRRLWSVLRVRDGVATLIEGEERSEVSVEDLVVVAEHRDRIYPGLVSTGRVERGGDKPFHTVINAENFHALEALAYTHEGRVDAIYIDPPYNTGAKDWKYNNDYVDSDDAYRHSKWLAFMERRLKLAKRLLNPENSVLIVTIDEKEVQRLGLLLAQLFPEARIQMTTIVIQGAGSSRKGELGRVEEYAYFLFIGDAVPHQSTDDLLNAAPSTKHEKVRWESLLRSGTGSERQASPNLFYPVYVDRDTGAIVGCGDSKPLSASRDEWVVPTGAVAVWPLKANDREGRWRCSPALLRTLITDGFARAGKVDRAGRGTIWYLGEAARRKVATGEFAVTGTDGQGAKTVEVMSADSKTFPIKTVWNRARHHAGWHGTNLVSALLIGRKFPFPKSLYAVEDAVRAAAGDKPAAVVLDFFAGSGTTAHAVMRLNKQDGGRRQCISVTNNEVSADEQKALRKQGLRPGDPEWEQHGICDYVTKPRIEAAITGRTPEGDPIKGDYKFTDEFPMSDGFEENAEFFTLTYEDPLRVEHHRSFARIAPLLWLKAGAQGRRIDEEPEAGYAVADTYAVLFDLDRTRAFLDEVTESDGVRMVFVLTDDERAFQRVHAELPAHVTTERLYGAYLTRMDHGPQVD